MDGPTNGLTDKASYKVKCTQLKSLPHPILILYCQCLHFPIPSFIGQKEKMCPKEVKAFNTCKVHECSTDLCNGGIVNKALLPWIGTITILAQMHTKNLFLATD